MKELPEGWTYSERWGFEWSRKDPEEPLYSFFLTPDFLRDLLSRIPAQAVLRRNELARVIRHRRRLSKQHSGDVSVGYDLALDSLVIDLAALVSDDRLVRHEFIEACDPKSAENDPSVIHDIDPPITSAEQLGGRLRSLINKSMKVLGAPSVLGMLTLELIFLHSKVGGELQGLLGVIRETWEDIKKESAKPEIKFLRSFFPEKHCYEIRCDCGQSCGRCQGTGWYPVSKEIYDATPERDRQVDVPYPMDR